MITAMKVQITQMEFSNLLWEKLKEKNGKSGFD